MKSFEYIIKDKAGMKMPLLGLWRNLCGKICKYR